MALAYDHRNNKTNEFTVEFDSCVEGSFPDICIFRYLNGGFLAALSLVGILLNFLVMYLIVRARIRLSNQKYFIFNLAVSDTLMAGVGLLRGLGIIYPTFVGYAGGRQSWWCTGYFLLVFLVSYTNCPCMVALTLDRLVAIVAPFKHRTLFTRKTCIALCVVVWVPQWLFYCYFMGDMASQKAHFHIEYYPNYHRCTSHYKETWLRTAQSVLLVAVPFAIIILMYIVIIYKVKQSGTKSRRLILLPVIIVISGAVCWFPSILTSTMNIHMSYKVSQVLTITLFYTNSSTDPLVYMLTMPVVKRYISSKLKGVKPRSSTWAALRQLVRSTVVNTVSVS